MRRHTLTTAPSFVRRLWRTARLAWLNWCIDCVRAERETYTATGRAGPIWQRESLQTEMRLLRRKQAIATGT